MKEPASVNDLGTISGTTDQPYFAVESYLQYQA